MLHISFITDGLYYDLEYRDYLQQVERPFFEELVKFADTGSGDVDSGCIQEAIVLHRERVVHTGREVCSGVALEIEFPAEKDCLHKFAKTDVRKLGIALGYPAKIAWVRIGPPVKGENGVP